jgi:hypothetical protein
MAPFAVPFFFPGPDAAKKVATGLCCADLSRIADHGQGVWQEGEG